MEIGRTGRMRDEELLAVVRHLLNGEADRRDRHVDDQVDLFGVVPAPRNTAADVRLELMVPDDHADRLAGDRAAEVVDGHLRRRHRALAGRRRRRAVHVGQNADLHNVVGNLSMSGARGKDNRNCEDGAR